MIRRLSIIAIVVALLVTAFFASFMYYDSLQLKKDFTQETASIDIPMEDTAFGGVFYNPSPDDSLPHILYRHQEDSLKQIKQEKDLINRGATGNGMNWWFFGVHQVKKQWRQYSREKKLQDSLIKIVADSSILLYNKRKSTSNKDTIRLYDELEEEMMHRLNQTTNMHLSSDTSLNGEDKHLHYFGLKNYELDYDNKFYVKDDSYYLAYVVWDTLIRRKYENQRNGHYEAMKIPFRYSTDNKELLFPISKHQYKTIYLVLQCLGVLQTFFVAYFLLGLPAQIIWNISRGKAFTEKNYRRLKTIGLLIFFFFLALDIFPYIVDAYLGSSIPEQFKMPPLLSAILSHIFYYLTGVVVFVLGLAFQRGHKLQQEQNLTI